jgi:uncharacterized protein (TIGR03083 family)
MATVEQLKEARDWYVQVLDSLQEPDWDKPSMCAGWTAKNVVAHVATGDRYVRGLVLEATGGDRSVLKGMPTSIEERQVRAKEASTWPSEKLRDFARQEAQEIVPVLMKAVKETPNTMIRMPFGEMPVAGSVRIRTLEYVIHGRDLQPATGKERAVPAWYIEYALPHAATMMTRAHMRSPHKGKSASFHLHRTDGEGEWTLRAENGEAVSEPGHDKSDVAFRGPAAGLYWVLMGRGGPEEHGVEVHGDPQLAGAFKEWFPGP